MPRLNEHNLKLDYDHTNDDYHGRYMHESQELVDYSSKTSHRIWLNQQTDNYDAHWHTAIEIIVAIENYYDATVGNEHFHINPGEILIVPPNELHSTEAPDWGIRFVYIMDISLISKLKGFSGIKSILMQPLLINRTNYPRVYDEIYKILLLIRNEYFSNNEYSELTIQAHMLNLFVLLGDNYNTANELFPNVGLHKQKEYVQKFNQALEFIDRHYMDDLSLEDVADYIGFSKYHFSRLFKQYTNYTFCDYVTYRRIKVAEEYLANPDYSITEVAMRSGFSSITTFNRLFKQQKGCTPSEYRSKNSTARRQKRNK